MKGHFLVFDFLMILGILSYLGEIFIIGHVDVLLAISFFSFIGVWFYLVFFLPGIIAKEEAREEAIRILSGNESPEGLEDYVFKESRTDEERIEEARHVKNEEES